MKYLTYLIIAFFIYSCGRKTSPLNKSKEYFQERNHDRSSHRECSAVANYLSQQFDQYNIIAIDEGPHGTLQTHSMLRGLFKNKTLCKKINYVILEFANSSHQTILNNYIKGDSVAITDLQNVWRQSTQAHSTTFQKPVFLKLLKAIRDVNRTLSCQDKILVLAGDPSINWNYIKTINDYFSAISQRDVLPSELAIKYGIDAAKNVLLIYGGEHLKKTSNKNRDSTYWTIPFYINQKHPGSILSIGAFSSEDYPEVILECPENSIIDLKEDSLGLLKANAVLLDSSTVDLKDLFDAVYYAGNSDEWRQDNASMIEAEFWEELNRRSTIIWGNGIDPDLKEN